MKLGMHAMAWCDQWNESALYAIDEVKALGLDFIEIPLTKPEGVNSILTRRKLRETGLDAVTSALITNARCDVTSPDPNIREAGVEFLKTCVRLTSEMGLSFFSGVLYSPHMKLHPDRPSMEMYQLAAEGLNQVARYAGTLGVTIGLEPINRFETFLVNTCEQALMLKKMIGEPNVCVHLDTFHMNMEEKNLRNAILLADQDLGHIHLNENDWGVPGTGHMDWDGIFQGLSEIHYTGYASLECVAEARGGYVWRELAPDNRTLVNEGIRFLKQMRFKHFGR
jgi:D-psicose/D-tagatose/L-ribulose 3-epimerase